MKTLTFIHRMLPPDTTPLQYARDWPSEWYFRSASLRDGASPMFFKARDFYIMPDWWTEAELKMWPWMPPLERMTVVELEDEDHDQLVAQLLDRSFADPATA